VLATIYGQSILVNTFTHTNKEKQANKVKTFKLLIQFCIRWYYI